MYLKILRTVLFLASISLASGMQAKILVDTKENKHHYLNELIDDAWDVSNLKPDSAMVLIEKGLVAANSELYTTERAELLRIKGLIYFYKVDFLEALNYFMQSRDLNQEIGNRKGALSALNNISLVYRRQGMLEKALEMDLDVLQMRRAIGDSIGVAQSLNNVAVSYQDKGQNERALTYYREALALSQKLQDSSSFDLYYNNIGVIFSKLKMSDSAFIYFNKSLDYSRALNNKQMASNSLTYLGDYFLEQKKYTKAIALFEESLTLAEDIGIVYEIESAAEGLHKAYAAAGRFNEAYATHILYKKMVDSANVKETMQKITALESQAIFEKEQELQQFAQEHKSIQDQLEITKQKQIKNMTITVFLASLVFMSLLYRNYRRKSVLNDKLMQQRDEIATQKEEIETQRDKIEALNDTKDKFFTIIAHDLKNPISGIFSLSELIYTSFNTIETEKLQEYVLQIHLSTKKTYELLETLLQWAMVQTGTLQIRPSVFNLTNVIQESIDLLKENAMQKKIAINLTQCDDCFAHADEKMITTVVRNLLNNAIKFSTDDSQIVFDIKKDEAFWEVSVKDQGIGIAINDQKALFDLNNKKMHIGNSKEKGTGLGLVLCKEFIELNKGDIWVDSIAQQGSTFYFTVPANGIN